MKDQLKNVERIEGSFGAFAAVLCDSTVVTWGDSDSGGDWVFLGNDFWVRLITEPHGIPTGDVFIMSLCLGSVL